jgi:hypothetical protein
MSTPIDEIYESENRLNSQLGLIMPSGLSYLQVEIYEELFDLIRQDYLANRVNVVDVPKILELFKKKDDIGKQAFVEKIYQTHFATTINSQVTEIADRVTTELSTEPKMITWEEYQSQLEELSKDLTPAQRDLFYYISYSELEGEEVDQRYIDYVNATPEEQAQMDAENLLNGIDPEREAQNRISQAMNKRKTLNLKDQGGTGVSSTFNKPFTAEDIQQLIES